MELCMSKGNGRQLATHVLQLHSTRPALFTEFFEHMVAL